MGDEALPLSDRARIRWWKFRSWFRRCPDCGRRGYSDVSPRWQDDRTALLLGIGYFGCPGCGHGAVEERDRGTCRSWCAEANHPGREHEQWTAAPPAVVSDTDEAGGKR